MKPIFSDKKSYNINIKLIENNKILTDDNKIAESFKTYFGNSAKELNIDMDPNILSTSEAYGVGHPSLHLINSYLSNRIQRVKVNSTFSSSWESLYGVPLGSILGPLLLNIYLCDLFNSLNEPTIVNYADDNTPLSIVQDINTVIKKLESNSIKVFQWLANNVVKANPEKSRILLSNKQKYSICTNQ